MNRHRQAQRRRISGFVAGLLVLAAAVRAAELRPAPGAARYRLGWQLVTVSRHAPVPLALEPSYKSADPEYLAIRLGNGANSIVTAVLDESGGTGAGYDTLYVDTNNNGDLTDDPVLRPTVRRSGATRALLADPFDLDIEYADGSRVQFQARLEMRAYETRRPKTLYWSIGCHLTEHMEGEVSIGSRKAMRVGLYDSTDGRIMSNGCFADYGVDRIRLDLDGDGKLAGDAENLPLSKVLVLDGKLWQLETVSSGRRLEIKECKLPTGMLAFRFRLQKGMSLDDCFIELTSRTHGYAFGFPMTEDERFELPEGSYRVARANVALPGPKGGRWLATFSMREPVTVRRGREGTVTVGPVGPPLRVGPKVRGRLRLGRTVCIMPQITGVGGERYENIAPADVRMAPTLKIVDANEVVVLQAAMEYG